MHEHSIPEEEINFPFHLEDVEWLDLLLTDIGRNYIHERIEWLREKRRDHEYADRLEEAFEQLIIFVGVCLTRDEVREVTERRGRERPGVETI